MFDKKNKYIKEILVSSRQIKKSIKKAAKWIDNSYVNKKLTVLCVLNGSIPFNGELISKVKTACVLDSVAMSSYTGVSTTLKPEVKIDLKEDVSGRDVLIVEDIVDTGHTITALINYLQAKNVASVRVMTLLDKKACRKIPFNPDYSCFEIEPHFVVGFGLDYYGYFRNLPYIGIFNHELYEKEKNGGK